MKTLILRHHPPRGSTVILVLILVGVLAISLIAYLSMVSQRAKTVARSQSWNWSMAVSEGGLEEALAHLNQTRGRNLNTNGWALQAVSRYFKNRDLGMGAGRYSVLISNVSPPIVGTLGSVEALAFVKAPGTTGEVRRAVRITTRFRPEVRGITVQNKALVQGMAKADSYNSNVGPYNPASPGDNSFIGNNSTMAQQLEVNGGAKIYGDVGTGAPGGLKLVSPSAIGDTLFANNPANVGQVEGGHYSTTLNVPVSTVPATPFPGAGSPLVAGGGHTYLLSGNNYKVNGTLTLDGSKTMMVTGNAVLWVTDTLTVKDTARILIAPGATLTVFLEKQFYAQGNSQINPGGLAEQFSYYGMNSNAEFYMSGFATLVGTVYSPAAKMDISGDAQLFGGGHASEIVLQGNAKFHFDEALSATSEQPFVITSWKEI